MIFKMNDLRDYIANHPDGFTINPITMEVPTKGYSVAVRETQNSFGEEGFQKALKYAIENGLYLGGWRDVLTGDYYYDATMVVETLEEAQKLARENEQLAFYGFVEEHEIRCEW